MRRFLLHVLPNGFKRIRHYGLLANRYRTDKLDTCRQLLGAVPPADAIPTRWTTATVTSASPAGRCATARTAGVATWCASNPSCRRTAAGTATHSPWSLIRFGATTNQVSIHSSWRRARVCVIEPWPYARDPESTSFISPGPRSHHRRVTVDSASSLPGARPTRAARIE